MWSQAPFLLLRLPALLAVAGAVLVATHNTEAVGFADRVLNIRDGSLTAFDSHSATTVGLR